MWSAGRCSGCCREGEGVGEPRSTRPRTCRLEYRFDRLLPDKLAQAYQLLVTDQRRPVGGNRERPLESAEPTTEINNEQASGHLRAGALGSTEGESHHRQSDGGADRVRAEKRIQCAAGMGLPLCHVLLASPPPLGDLGAWRSERAFWRAAWLLICEERVCRGHLSIDTG